MHADFLLLVFHDRSRGIDINRHSPFANAAAVFNCLNNMGSGQATIVWSAACWGETFGRQNNLIAIAAGLHPAADNRFGFTHGVCGATKGTRRRYLRNPNGVQRLYREFFVSRLINLHTKGHGA